MKDNIFSSVWTCCCISRSQIKNHKITFSGKSNTTESCKSWHMELPRKSGLCCSATSVHGTGSVKALIWQLHLHQKYICLCFLFYHSQPRGKNCSKSHFVGSINCQPWLLCHFCLTGKSLSPSWNVFFVCFFLKFIWLFFEKVRSHSNYVVTWHYQGEWVSSFNICLS